MPVTIVPNGPASDSVNGDWISDKVIFSFHCHSLFTRMHHLCSVSSSINVQCRKFCLCSANDARFGSVVVCAQNLHTIW
jgi:hypothetical protein